MIARFYGVDPGLVHTGLVRLQIDTDSKRTLVKHWLMDGYEPDNLPDDFTQDSYGFLHQGWVEGYRPRTNLPNDRKKVVRRGLMEELKLWQFSTSSHHQDLRSAAYIMLFGMLKDPKWNKVLSSMVEDWYYRRDWPHDVEN